MDLRAKRRVIRRLDIGSDCPLISFAPSVCVCVGGGICVSGTSKRRHAHLHAEVIFRGRTAITRSRYHLLFIGLFFLAMQAIVSRLQSRQPRSSVCFYLSSSRFRCPAAKFHRDDWAALYKRITPCHNCVPCEREQRLKERRREVLRATFY